MAERTSIVVLSDDELLELAEQAMSGRGSLEDVFCARIFGGTAPEAWGDWPDAAVRMWDRTVDFWRDLRTEHAADERYGKRNPMPVRTSWKALEEARREIVPSGRSWMELPFVTWGHIASTLGLGEAATAYHFGALGWRMDGRLETRHVVRAPCVRCGRVHPAGLIRRRTGGCCRG